MAKVVVIRIYAEKPTMGFSTDPSEASFNKDLVGLTIGISDLSFADPKGINSPIGSATYKDPLVSPYYTNADRRAGCIVQHEVQEGLAPPVPAAVATAAIVIDEPSGYTEYGSSDLRLTITRVTQVGTETRTQTIVDQSINYNVDTVTLDSDPPLPDPTLPSNYSALSPVALYLALPPADIGLVSGLAFVNVPVDGSPPNYTELLNAVTTVLDADPGNTDSLGSLSIDQCRHIANEIIWNRALLPLPPPEPNTLEVLYTTNLSGFSADAHSRFEADLSKYYTTNHAQAEVLAKYVMALSTAIACEGNSTDAPSVGFTFPVLPGVAGSADKILETKVTLSNS